MFLVHLERCIAVHAPLLAKRFCTVTSARHSMYTLLTVIIVFLSSAAPFVYDTNDPKHVQKCAIRQKLRSTHRIVQPLLFYGLPYIFLLSNLLTVSALCRRHQQLPLRSCDEKRQSDSRVNDVHSSRKQRQLTVMLITVSLAFYVFTTPAMIVFITDLFPTKDRDLTKMKRSFLFGQISVVLLQANNAVSNQSHPDSMRFHWSLGEFSLLLVCWSTFSTGHSTDISRIVRSHPKLLSSLYPVRQAVSIESLLSLSNELHG